MAGTAGRYVFFQGASDGSEGTSDGPYAPSFSKFNVLMAVLHTLPPSPEKLPSKAGRTPLRSSAPAWSDVETHAGSSESEDDTVSVLSGCSWESSSKDQQPHPPRTAASGRTPLRSSAPAFQPLAPTRPACQQTLTCCAAGPAAAGDRIPWLPLPPSPAPIHEAFEDFVPTTPCSSARSDHSPRAGCGKRSEDATSDSRCLHDTPASEPKQARPRWADLVDDDVNED